MADTKKITPLYFFGLLLVAAIAWYYFHANEAQPLSVADGGNALAAQTPAIYTASPATVATAPPSITYNIGGGAPSDAPETTASILPWRVPDDNNYSLELQPSTGRIAAQAKSTAAHGDNGCCDACSRFNKQKLVTNDYLVGQISAEFIQGQIENIKTVRRSQGASYVAAASAPAQAKQPVTFGDFQLQALGLPF